MAPMFDAHGPNRSTRHHMWHSASILAQDVGGNRYSDDVGQWLRTDALRGPPAGSWL